MGRHGMQTALRLLGIGWYVALSIAGLGYGGFWLDRQWETSPLLTLLGLGLGIAVALIGMFRMIMALFDDRPRHSDAEPSPSVSRPRTKRTH